MPALTQLEEGLEISVGRARVVSSPCDIASNEEETR